MVNIASYKLEHKVGFIPRRITRGLTGWTYRKRLDIIGSTAGAISDYQIKIIVHYGSGTDSGEHVYLNGKCRSDFGDIRFTDSDGITELSYWIEEKVDGDYAIFWVKIPYIPAYPDTAIIYIYYGNPDAITTSDGDATFLFFDHFEGTELDTTKWEGIEGDIEVSDSTVKVRDLNTGVKAVFYSIDSWFENVAFRCKARLLYLNEDTTWGFRTPTSPYDSITFWLSSDGLATTTENEGTGTTKVVGGEDTNFHTWDATWVSGKAKFYKDDTLLEEHTTNMPDEALRIRVATLRRVSGTNSGIEIDWVFIRKYIEPEPSHGDWGLEETFFKPYDLY